MRRAEGGAKMFGVFRVKNHDFTPKNHIFSNFRGGGGGGAGCVPLWIRPWNRTIVERDQLIHLTHKYIIAHFPDLAQALQYKVERAKLVLWPKTSPLRQKLLLHCNKLNKETVRLYYGVNSYTDRHISRSSNLCLL
jgi:hypothetical protein